mmetsp:Transcript_4725/g.15053  ORF Transcript_4725/g.15053 Transcript_4725/m.15053 type:complete len:81 (-) Transcript_4725:1225-1467(-)
MRYTATLRFTYADERRARVVEESLAVDAELNADRCVRTSEVAGNAVIVTFRCDDAKQLRVSVGGFFELAAVANEAVDAFA